MSASLQLSVYEKCATLYLGNTDMILKCIADRVEKRAKEMELNTTNWLLVIAGALVFFMQAGFAMVCAGSVRKKNVVNTMLKNFLDACGSAVAFFMFGYAFAFGGQTERTDITFAGTANFFGAGQIDAGFWFFQYAFSATAATIVAGTLAERSLMVAYLMYSVILSAFVYPIVAHALWSNNGFLSAFSNNPLMDISAIDFAGSGVAHLTGGTTALIATIILGPRRGRFYNSDGDTLDTPKSIKGHSMALQMLGTMILWFGWYGFNCGSALLLTLSDNASVAAHVAANTSLAAAAGGLSSLGTQFYMEHRQTGEWSFDLIAAMNGTLSGLVAITAGCATVELYAACLIGIIAGWVYVGTSALLIRLKIDDAVNAIPVHLFNGAWGLIATGLFSSPTSMLAAYGSDKHVGWFYSLGRGSTDATLLLVQLTAMAFIVAWVFTTMMPFFSILNHFGWLRVHVVDELVGLDMTYHGGGGTGEEQEYSFEDKVTQEEIVAAYKNSMAPRNRKSSQRRMQKDKGDSTSRDGDLETALPATTSEEMGTSMSSGVNPATSAY